jgi:zinc protease
LFIQRDRIGKVSAADVNRVAKTYFQKPNRTVGVYVPEKESRRVEVAAAPPLADVVKDYKGGTTVAAGEAFDPSPANLDARLKTATAGGLKVGLLPRRTAARRCRWC